jgi:APA family basic amino acid/polyamine antiporter
MVISYMGANGSTVFTTLVLMTGITAAVPYAFSALAQIAWRVRDRRAGQSQRMTRDVVVAVAALVFSVAFIYYSRNSGASWYVVLGPFLMAGGASVVGIPVYLAQRRHMTRPEPTPSYR